MAKKNLSGQMSVFDFFRDLENEIPNNGQVEMNSFVPCEEDVSSIENKVSKVDDKDIVMRKVILSDNDGDNIIISYANYNKVIVEKSNEAARIYQFDTSKEAVDYYIEQINQLKEPE